MIPEEESACYSLDLMEKEAEFGYALLTCVKCLMEEVKIFRSVYNYCTTEGFLPYRLIIHWAGT